MALTSKEIGVLTRRAREVRAHPEAPMPMRWLLMARRLYEGGTITVRWLMDEFAVSLATAKRDMVLIEAHLPTVRDPRERRNEPVTIRMLFGPRVHGHITDDDQAVRLKGSRK